tara:strand:+ start:10103 stop:10309 length:207 start_codon:yes stop_codon:yes gene_type:complete
LSKTVVYYEYERILGVNSTHDDSDCVRIYNYFSSLVLFKQWIAYEMGNCQIVEITDKNYCDLVQKGVI